MGFIAKVVKGIVNSCADMDELIQAYFGVPAHF